MPWTTFRLPMQKLLLTSLRTTCGNQRHICSKLCQNSHHWENSAGSHGHTVKNKSRSSRHFYFIFVNKILSHNFALTTKLPASGVNYQKNRDQNFEITVIHLNIYLRTKRKWVNNLKSLMLPLEPLHVIYI